MGLSLETVEGFCQVNMANPTTSFVRALLLLTRACLCFKQIVFWFADFFEVRELTSLLFHSLESQISVTAEVQYTSDREDTN